MPNPSYPVGGPTDQLTPAAPLTSPRPSLNLPIIACDRSLPLRSYPRFPGSVFFRRLVSVDSVGRLAACPAA